jgi:hypothetical protein
MKRSHLLLVLLLATACSHNPPPDRVQAVVAQAPPAARAENRGRRPHDGWVWVPGYWNWSNERHVWVPGMWSLPPRGFHSWEAAHWTRTKQGWVLVRGRWK